MDDSEETKEVERALPEILSDILTSLETLVPLVRDIHEACTEDDDGPSPLVERLEELVTATERIGDSVDALTAAMRDQQPANLGELIRQAVRDVLAEPAGAAPTREPRPPAGGQFSQF